MAAKGKKELENQCFDENTVAYQSNELVEANYKLTIGEQKVILNICAHIDPDSDHVETLRIPARELSDACDFDAKYGYRKLQNILKKILTRALIVAINGKEYGTHWIQSYRYISYIESGTKSYVEVNLDPLLCPQLLQLKERYLKTNLKHLISFKHVYSTRFYMIFKNRLKVGKLQMTFKRVQELLQLPKSYQNTVDLKNKVIKLAVNEINEKSDITVEYEYYRDGGRAHVGVIFTFHSKEREKQVLPVSEHPVKRVRLGEEEQAEKNNIELQKEWKNQPLPEWVVESIMRNKQIGPFAGWLEARNLTYEDVLTGKR